MNIDLQQTLFYAGIALLGYLLRWWGIALPGLPVKPTPQPEPVILPMQSVQSSGFLDGAIDEITLHRAHEEKAKVKAKFVAAIMDNKV